MQLEEEEKGGGGWLGGDGQRAVRRELGREGRMRNESRTTCMRIIQNKPKCTYGQI